MDSKSKILIIGATGYLSKFILEASVLYGHQTFALVREQTFAQENIQHYFNNLGVNVIIGDIYDYESLVNALKKVRSHTLSLIEDQKKIIAAIQEAGNIKRFLPSEFGMDVDKAHNVVEPAKSLFKAKSEIRRLIEKENIPFTIVCANYFARICLQNFFQPNIEAQGPPTESVFILGDGIQRDTTNLTVKMILCVAHSVFVRGDQSNFEINPSIGVEASILYPELQYIIVDDILNLFL